MGALGRDRHLIADEKLDQAVAVPRLDDAEASGVAHAGDLDRQAVRGEADELGPYADLEPLAVQGFRRRILDADRKAAEIGLSVLDFARHHVHARRADEMPDEGMMGPLEQLDRRSD